MFMPMTLASIAIRIVFLAGVVALIYSGYALLPRNLGRRFPRLKIVLGVISDLSVASAILTIILVVINYAVGGGNPSMWDLAKIGFVFSMPFLILSFLCGLSIALLNRRSKNEPF